ncbi:hypothetical protein HNY73_008754 [Argiope bruennichi]|uniref:Uncharacterized protein n=1 Tax=Argiope bruennichi TaxID=94029 RepID=A0A8T0F7G4_ARGBR|nr:hypothetical protein HNY73_008754 [Argiope bruennichi]
MVFCIQKFSSSLCFAHITALSIDDLPPACFDLTDDTEDVRTVIYKLGRMYEKELKLIAEKIGQEYLYETFMKSLLSRSILISDKPSYLSFLLLCSLIETLAGPIFIEQQCLTYAVMCALCLKSVYQRCYKDLFDEKEESESLDSYCRSINTFPFEAEKKLLLSADEQRQISLLLSNAVDIDYNNDILTDTELEILHNTMDIMFPEDFRLNSFKPTGMCCECDSFSNDAEDVKEEMNCACSKGEDLESVNSDEDEECSTRVNRICNLCFGKCFRYLVLYKGEILEQESSVDNDRSNCNA